MKVVTRLEDINTEMWCFATKENFEFLKSIGIKFHYNVFEEFSNQEDFDNLDVFRFAKSEYTPYYTGYWCGRNHKQGVQFICEPDKTSELIKNLGFIKPDNFNIEIFKILGTGENTEYIGIINNNTPAKWNSEGVCLIPGNTYNLYKEYKQRIYTKPNPAEFYPRQKFIISSTEKMSTSFEKQGWRLATNEEIEEFKF